MRLYCICYSLTCFLTNRYTVGIFLCWHRLHFSLMDAQLHIVGMNSMLIFRSYLIVFLVVSLMQLQEAKPSPSLSCPENSILVFLALKCVFFVFSLYVTRDEQRKLVGRLNCMEELFIFSFWLFFPQQFLLPFEIVQRNESDN